MRENNQDYQAAKKRVKKIKGFYGHLASYFIMGVFFFVMNMSTSPDAFWFHFPMMGWGIGLAFHYIGVFGVPGLGALDQEWEKREIEKEMIRLKSARGETYQDENHEIDHLDLEKNEHTGHQFDDFELRDMETLKRNFKNRF